LNLIYIKSEGKSFKSNAYCSSSPGGPEIIEKGSSSKANAKANKNPIIPNIMKKIPTYRNT